MSVELGKVNTSKIYSQYAIKWQDIDIAIYIATYIWQQTMLHLTKSTYDKWILLNFGRRKLNKFDTLISLIFITLFQMIAYLGKDIYAVILFYLSYLCGFPQQRAI